MTQEFSIRYSRSADELKTFTTAQCREHYLVKGLFRPNHVEIVYSMQDRFIIGGAQPQGEALPMPVFEPLTKADFFLERREMGIINVGGSGKVYADGQEYPLGFKDALYIGRGVREVIFHSDDAAQPAKYYFNSTTAHAAHPAVLIPQSAVTPVELGDTATANRRNIYQYIVAHRVESCQLVMGLTELQSPSVWNTFPPHTHYRRNEVYFYFDLPPDQLVLHLMGEPTETRHLMLRNEEAVISPEWSIHSGAGTCAYAFIWGMGGENREYSDMDKVEPSQLR